MADGEAQKVGHRFWKQRDHLFTFLKHEGVDATNNATERALRPAVVAGCTLRKAHQRTGPLLDPDPRCVGSPARQSKSAIRPHGLSPSGVAQGAMVRDLLATLEQFHPLVAGTFPIGIHTSTSDLDVLCEVHDFEQFESVVVRAFGHHQGYSLHILESEPRAIVVNFNLHGTAIEIFGQDKPVYEQNGFRHLIMEGRLLCLGGSTLRDRVIALKRQGTKTEPAFAEVLRLSGDPYEALLALESKPDSSLRELVDRALDASTNRSR